MERRYGVSNMEVFNMVFLAKQGWRPVHSLDSFLARVVRAKYHPQFSFLDMPLVPRASYAWTLIWEACGLLSRGLR